MTQSLPVPSTTVLTYIAEPGVLGGFARALIYFAMPTVC